MMKIIEPLITELQQINQISVFFNEETMDISTAKSTAGSPILTPPTALINTS